ncbi:MAG: DNA-binding CsgD family transcriptional regulator [Alphaproteobacteria bacterium]|jgi:DNA-binding CsgD family transcriptional regulator
MHQVVLDFIDKARHCKTIEELSTAVQCIFEQLGFPLWAYQTYDEVIMAEASPIFIHNFPEKWGEYYMDNNCIEVDPVIKLSKKSIVPFQWSQAYTIEDNKKEGVKEYQSTASDFNMNDGITIPIIGGNGRSSLLSLSTSYKDEEFQKLMSEHQETLMLVSLSFHSIAKDLIRDGNLTISRADLTDRERECLLWTAKGKSCWGISMILGISERTVLYHLSNAKNKFKVSSKYHLVAKAIAEGYITI